MIPSTIANCLRSPSRLPPYSVCPSPYRWLREEYFQVICEAEDLDLRGPTNPDRERGWVYEPDRQLNLLKHFWSKFEVAKSLIFFYCNEGNPVAENFQRILVGVGRILQYWPAALLWQETTEVQRGPSCLVSLRDP